MLCSYSFRYFGAIIYPNNLRHPTLATAVTNNDYSSDNICNHLGDKLLCMSERAFLNWVYWNEKTQPEVRNSILSAGASKQIKKERVSWELFLSWLEESHLKSPLLWFPSYHKLCFKQWTRLKPSFLKLFLSVFHHSSMKSNIYSCGVENGKHVCLWRTQMDKDGGAVMKGFVGQPGRLSCWCCWDLVEF